MSLLTRVTSLNCCYAKRHPQNVARFSPRTCSYATNESIVEMLHRRKRGLTVGHKLLSGLNMPYLPVQSKASVFS